MRKVAVLVLILVTFSFLSASFAQADRNNDYQTIKKAVKENPGYQAGKEVKWFKVLITDANTNKDRVKVTIPISLIELFLKCAKNKHWRIDDDLECDIDIEAIFKELKELGPMALIEVYDEGEIIKVWLE